MTLNDSFDLATEGMNAQSARLQVHALNMAHVATPNYKRRIPVLSESNSTTFDDLLYRLKNQGVQAANSQLDTTGVTMAGVVEDPTPGKKIYNPTHPEADKNGYVTLSNTNVLGDMADAMVASKFYEANIAVMSVVKAMANKALELGRGQ
jgi:flagellar basal-body rod protein FlgC